MGEDRKSTSTISYSIDLQCYVLISSSCRGVDIGLLNVWATLLSAELEPVCIEKTMCRGEEGGSKPFSGL